MNSITQTIEIQDVIENDIGRFYVIEGITYPSMTTVLGVDSAEYIDKWKERVGIEVATKKTEHALRRGNAIHKMAEDYLLTGEYDQSDVYFNMLFKPIKKWLDKNVIKILSVEDVLFSKKLKIAGRCDLIALTHDGWKIIDFKTAEKYKEPEWISNYYMQASGYAYCHNEMYQSKINRFTILIVNESSMNVDAYDGYAHEHIRALAEKRLKFKQLHNV